MYLYVKYGDMTFAHNFVLPGCNLPEKGERCVSGVGEALCEIVGWETLLVRELLNVIYHPCFAKFFDDTLFTKQVLFDVDRLDIMCLYIYELYR